MQELHGTNALSRFPRKFYFFQGTADGFLRFLGFRASCLAMPVGVFEETGAEYQQSSTAPFREIFLGKRNNRYYRVLDVGATSVSAHAIALTSTHARASTSTHYRSLISTHAVALTSGIMGDLTAKSSPNLVFIFTESCRC